jgi:hypothetical protein
MSCDPWSRDSTVLSRPSTPLSNSTLLFFHYFIYKWAPNPKMTIQYSKEEGTLNVRFVHVHIIYLFCSFRPSVCLSALNLLLERATKLWYGEKLSPSTRANYRLDIELFSFFLTWIFFSFFLGQFFFFRIVKTKTQQEWRNIKKKQFNLSSFIMCRSRVKCCRGKKLGIWMELKTRV